MTTDTGVISRLYNLTVLLTFPLSFLCGSGRDSLETTIVRDSWSESPEGRRLDAEDIAVLLPPVSWTVSGRLGEK